MAMLTCPRCKESFSYQPGRPDLQRVLQHTISSGADQIVLYISCPHCPAQLQIDPKRPQCSEFNASEVAKGMANVIYDEAFTGENIRLVQQLISEGDRLLSVDVRQAESKFREALNLRKHDPVAWYNLGVCRHKLADADGAVDAYRHALRFDRNLVQAYNNLGTILSGQGKLDEADNAFDSGLAVAPDNAKLYYGKAINSFARRDPVSMRRLLNVALEKSPDYEPAKAALRRLDQGR